ncbi:peptidase family M1-domain-containing protein [Daedaleopsis nitida]|nr:peptidase family M1-domain-containing protein [Daedaleopsis nitida]
MAQLAAEAKDYRLPTDVIPTHYDVKILTDLENLRFEGVVNIQLQVKKETTKIVLNSLELSLGEVVLSSSGDASSGDAQDAVAREFDAVQQRAIFTFAKALPAGSTAQLTISFDAPITDHMMGYYKSTGGADGKTIYALTQFQPTSARRAFPCWDEPALKATFAITMVSRKDSVNISNMPAASEGPYDPEHSESDSWLAKKMTSLPDASEWKVTKFQTTPPMSTYLIAYANGPFEYVESSYTSPLSGKVRPLRFYVTADCIPQARFAIDTIARIMPVYEQMYDVEYPLPKLDLLGSSDFDLGGMENWGLIVGRNVWLLYDESSNNIQHKKDVASMVGHEVAHMWFGDITTMEWWDNLYLNEGELMGDKVILGTIWPEWNSDSEFLSTSFMRARSLDCKLSSHPVEVECPDANKILQIFDALSYAKAGSVLRMLSSYVGEERFMQGVSLYLKKHTYKNTVTKDLWEGIQAATGVDIPKMMDNWIKEMGYPVITVTEKEGGIRVRQDRFLETGPAEPKDNETIWVAPLSLLTVFEDGTPVLDKDILLDEREKFIPLDTSRPFKLNGGTTGFFAVRYSAARLAKLGEQATAPNSPFTVSDRIGLVLDAFALAKAGYAPLSSALGLVSSLKGETEYFVLDTIATNLSAIISTWYEHPHVVELLNAFRSDLFSPLVKRLGYEHSEADSPNVLQLRASAIEQAALAGDSSVIEQLKSRFDHFLQTGDVSKIPSHLSNIAFRIGVQEGGKPEWELVKSVAAQPKHPGQGLSAMLALGASRDRALAEATFAFILDGARNQDVLYYARGLQRNSETRRLLAEKTKAHFPALEKRFAGTFNMTRWIQTSFETLSTEEDYKATAEFFEGRDTSGYDMALKQALDNIQARATWIKRSTDELVRWLEQRS